MINFIKNKKKLFSLPFIFILICLYCFSGCTSNKIDKQNFTIGFDAEFPPYGYKDDNGEYVGLDIDLAEEVCKRNNWNFIKQPIEWNSKDMELKTQNIDCIWNGFTQTGREDAYTWSTPYLENSQVIVVNNNSNINNCKDLSNKIVAVQTDSSALAAFTGKDASQENIDLLSTFKELQQISDYNNAFLNLESGTIDAICMDVGVAKYEIKKRNNNFRLLDEKISSEKYAVGFLKGNTELRDQVQNTLADMMKDGSLNKIAQKWDLDSCICFSPDDKYIDNNSDENIDFVEKLTDISKQLLSGVGASLAIFVLTLIFSLPLGLLITMGRMSKFKPVSLLIKIYISIVRGTPLMLQLLVVFFGPYFAFGIKMPSNYRFFAVIIGFTLNYAAYFAEIYRSGIQAVPVGQYEAAEILGYSKTQRFFKIIFPQMLKNIIPPITNEVITLVKDTSLAFAISFTEMFTLAKQVAATQTTIMPLFIAGAFYYIFNFIVVLIMNRIENKFNYFK